MIVVADAGPVRYLVVIGAIDVLQPLYDQVFVPQTVARELDDPSTPETVRAWIGKLPPWCEILPDPAANPALHLLDPGERAAIALAVSIQADRILIDDLAGRDYAELCHLQVTGTLGVLAEAHLAGLLDFETALQNLRQARFYLSELVVTGVRQRLARAREEL
jgi:predicted nucleic acid-binding protein